MFWIEWANAKRLLPFGSLHGIGKPEPLKYQPAGVRSRRITREHGLVYKVTGKRVDFLQAKYHY
jgi:toxin YoeB